MSDSEQEDELAVQLGAEECDRLCKEFADITATDSVVAMMFLQRNMWNIQGAVETYYNQFVLGDDRPLSARLDNQSSASIREVDDKEEEVKAGTSSSGKASKASTSSKRSTPPASVNKRIRVLSWNTDGLDSCEPKARATCLSNCILEEDADIVMLQEVTAETTEIYDKKLGESYSISYGSFDDSFGGYFTAVGVKKDSGTVERTSFQPFGTSQMGRGLQVVEAKLYGVPTTVITTHLESMKDMAAERTRQLKIMFKAARSTDLSRAVFVGGDLNLREAELGKVDGIPKGFSDTWEATGSRKEARWSWDMQHNDNHNSDFGGNFKPRCRFDRLYFRSADDVTVKPVYFELVGLRKKTPLKRFPSDHFGILFHADLVSPVVAVST